MMLTFPPPPAFAAARGRRPVPPRRLALLLVLGWVGQVCVRLWMARTRTGPVAAPDENGYLVAARLLAGGPGADLSGNTFYQGGYPLLFAPAHGVTHDPADVYLVVIVLNALVGAALFPLGYAAARRLGMAAGTALTASWAAALLPAVTFFGAFALADAVLPVVALGWLLLLDRFARDGRIADAAGASAVAAYACAVHTRGTVLLAVHCAVLAVLAFRRPRPALFGVAVAACGYAVAGALNGWVRAELYPGGVRDLGGNVMTRLTTLDGQAWAVSGAVGQLWYLVVSTWGLGGVGLVAAGAALARRGAFGTRVMAGALLAVTSGIAYASSAALPDEHRVGNFAYGRYLSCLALVYTLIGLAVLARAGTRTAVRCALGAGAMLAVTGAWVMAYAGHRLRTHNFIAFDFPETNFLTQDQRAFHLPEASLAAFGLVAVFLVARRAGWTAVAVALAAVNLAALTFTMGTSSKRVVPPPPLPGPAAGGVAIDVNTHWRAHIGLVEQVWWTRVSRVDVRAGVPANVCTVVVPRTAGAAPESTWPGRPAGWRVHPGDTAGYLWAAWRDPSCPAR
ncbi:hypothetical protein GCM10009678_44740 [Actinomadura kijaniata]|uniref:Glycosyltransferase RgtA/B/C/D-like domain-containing protein n=1 Tax=Actinomadura namibiensis TaxID=182080 RepID=A0A7W3LWY4_ACTNM|nr:hypothetical protein [Actinomadura namibiensis]MBA8955777.1 hypothetical protein [Actinomadura namibiensis]